MWLPVVVMVYAPAEPVTAATDSNGVYTTLNAVFTVESTEGRWKRILKLRSWSLKTTGSRYAQMSNAGLFLCQSFTTS